MREINNNSNSLNFSGVQKLDQQKEVQAPAIEANVVEQPALAETQDLSQMPTAVTGRSLVSKTDSIDNDIKFMMKNPAFCAKANDFFDIAEKQTDYENASKLMDGFVKEFQK
ncbi:hypothetical protein IKU74_08885 [bacterium]|nr:hypothetical protein [bacterium]